MNKLKGKVVYVGDVQTFKNDFRKKVFRIEYTSVNPHYPSTTEFVLLKDNINTHDWIKEGDEVEVSFILRGKSFQGNDGVSRFFQDAEAWKVEKNRQEDKPNAFGEITVSEEDIAGDKDDLPF